METTRIENVKNPNDLTMAVYQNDDALNIMTTYGEFVLISKEDYEYFLNLRETQEIETNEGLNKHLLKSMHQSQNDFLSESEVEWDV